MDRVILKWNGTKVPLASHFLFLELKLLYKNNPIFGSVCRWLSPMSSLLFFCLDIHVVCCCHVHNFNLN